MRVPEPEDVNAENGRISRSKPRINIMPESSARMNEPGQRSAKSRQARTYKPRSTAAPSEVLPNPDYITVLDQGPEGAAVGHGMATTNNYLLRERGIYERVSVRMLQQLSK